MSFQAAAANTTVSVEMSLIAWDEAMEKVSGYAAKKDAARVKVEQLAVTMVEWKDFNGDWKDAAVAQEDAVVKAASMLGIEIIIWTSAYDCPRRWSWEVC